ncbi:MAG: hypothetical protein KJZ87_20245, partial [Thermoguttaceae bacterium]|nr:hypothetical protein [Thermoguttaceae bacterium]
IDKSHGALQVLGTPTQSVYFTSFHDETLGKDSEPNSTTAAKGDWGGLVFRNDLDYDYIAAYDPGMTTAAREVLETQGIFLNYVNHADIRYGGGEVIVNSVRGIYDPIHMAEARPTATYNTIRFSADAAMSGDPNSFADTRFQNWDSTSPFTQEYDRVGPLVRGNRLLDNSVNGMYIRIRTDPGQPISEQEVAARWDDWDIVHVVPENLFLNGTPGGALRAGRTTNLSLVDEHHIQTVAGSSILDTETFTLFDGRNEVAFEFDRLPNANGVAAGRQQILIDPTDSAAVVASKIAVAINNVYNTGKLEISATAAGNIVTLTLDGAEIRLDGFGTYVARTDARLQVDPGMIVKLQGSRIETEIGAQLIAEGRGGTGDAPGYKVIFTSLLDDRYGAGGTFNTSDNTGTQQPSRGDWGGISFGPLSEGSIDQAVIAYGGGGTAIEGGFANFDPIEIRQANVRVANSRFEYNKSGSAGDRNGRGFIGPATIYVRGAQPVIVNNDFLDNDGAIVSIDVNALKSTVVPDWGRSTGAIGDFSAYGDNRGPLVRENRMSDTRKNGSTINAMEVRGGILTTESVWDDTDIVHVLTTQVIVRNFHHVGGLRLQSGVDESLVVKLQGANAGFVAEGTALEIDDRIGGTIQIVGMPGHPVVLTALADDSLGAGFDLFDRPQFDTNGNGIQVGAATPGAWAGITLDRYSNDRNVGVVNERELPYGSQADANSRPLQGAETLGELAPEEKAGDDNLRLGFEIRGSIRFDSPDDADVYVFKATPGTEIWLDIDRTTHALDAIIEVIDADGNVLARSDNSPAEVTSDDVYGDTSLLYEKFDSLRVKTMDRDRWFPSDRAAPATDSRDFYTTNPRDPGMRLVLDGPAGGQARDYYIRVRSSLSMGVTGGDSSIVEGSYFIVSFPDRNDATRLVEFEFDKAGDGIGTSPVGNPRYGIAIAAGDTADQVAMKIRDAVNSAAANEQLALSLSALPVTARILGAGTSNVRVVLDGLHVGFNPRSTEANGTRALTHLANTSGAYQLQLRLREMQEIPGSTVRYADIRYAQTGIEVLGFPGHSPLTGESSELSGDNNTLSGANP